MKHVVEFVEVVTWDVLGSPAAFHVQDPGEDEEDEGREERNDDPRGAVLRKGWNTRTHTHKHTQTHS